MTISAGLRRPAGVEDGLMGVALLAGPANVVMQLARPGVGYGVLESRVHSGRADLHPFKRARTTFTYLAVANRGTDAQKAAFRHCAESMSLATTLQVPPEMWPADRAAFDRYWVDSLERVHIDDAVRDYLYPIAANRIRGVRLPRPVREASENFALLMTTGFLPQRFRDEMRLPWDPRRQARFDRMVRANPDREQRDAARCPAVPVQSRAA